MSRTRFPRALLIALIGLLAFAGCMSQKPEPSPSPDFTNLLQSSPVVELPTASASQPLLSGYDALSGSPKQTCVVRKVNEPDKVTRLSSPTANPNGSDGPSLATSYALNDVSDAHSLRSSSLHTISAALSYAGTGSLNASSTSGQNYAFSQYSRIVSIEASSEHQTIYNVDVRLTDEAARLWKTPSAFRNKCGDRYIAAVVKGSAFSALVSFEQQESSEDDSVAHAISVAAKGAGATEQDIEQLHSATASSNYSVQIISKAVKGNVDASFDGIIKTSQRLPTDAAESDFTVRELALPYPRPDTSNLQLSELQETDVASLADLALEIRKRINSLTFIAANEDDFPGFHDAVIKSEIRHDGTLINTLLGLVQQCAQDSSRCTVPTVEIPDLPQRPLWHAITDGDIKTNGPVPLFVSLKDYPAKVEFKGQWRLSANAPEGWMSIDHSTHLSLVSNGTGNDVGFHFPMPGRWYDVPPYSTVSLRFYANPQSDAYGKPGDQPQWRRYDDIPLRPVVMAQAKGTG